MGGMIFLYCLIGAALGVVYYINIKRDREYKIEEDRPFLAIIALACAPFAAPIALALYLVWKFGDKE